MNLKDLVKTGKIKKPICLMLYGPAGIGKTTFASGAPSPIFVTAEEVDQIDSARLPKCESFDDFTKQLNMVKEEAHDYKTLVIDTVDSIEGLLWKKIVNDDPKASDMATACGGFGKGYLKAAEIFTDVRDRLLVPIRERGMNIVLLCHSSKNKTDDLFNQTSYDTFEMKLHKTGKGYGSYTVFSEWVDSILFANFKVHTLNSGNNTFAIGDGKRVIYCTPRPTHDAKNRFDLPDEIPMDYKAFNAHVQEYYQGKTTRSPKQLREECLVLANKILDEELKAKTISNIEAVGLDADRLNSARTFIRGVING